MNVAQKEKRCRNLPCPCAEHGYFDRLRKMIRAAWENLSGEERKAFTANYVAVTKLIDSVFACDESARTAFDHAGIGEEMEQLVESAYARVCWAALRDGTIHMGD